MLGQSQVAHLSVRGPNFSCQSEQSPSRPSMDLRTRNVPEDLPIPGFYTTTFNVLFFFLWLFQICIKNNFLIEEPSDVLMWGLF